MTVFPFGDTADVIEIKGEHLIEAFEFGVSKWNPKSPAGRFLQVSGKFDLFCQLFLICSMLQKFRLRNF